MTAGQKEYQRGLVDEVTVKAYLKTRFSLRDSSEHEDRTLDIDAYLNEIPVSIKCMAATTPKNFAFELEVQDSAGVWHNSLFHNGKADKYVVWHRGMNTIFGIDKLRLLTYIETYGFDRITGLSAKVKEMQKFHRDKDVKCGLLSIDKLVNANVAIILTNTFTGQ